MVLEWIDPKDFAFYHDYQFIRVCYNPENLGTRRYVMMLHQHDIKRLSTISPTVIKLF